jgi:predicted proteasome-type protease
MIELFLTLLAAIDFFWTKKLYPEELATFRQAAHDELRAYHNTSQAEAVRFIGEQIQIMQEKDELRFSNHKKFDYSCTFIVRNPVGEYFMYLHTHEAAPFIKHISQSNAKILLGKKYLAPLNEKTNTALA